MHARHDVAHDSAIDAVAVIAAMLLGVVMVASSASPCAVGTHVVLRAVANDQPRIFVWDSTSRLSEWHEGRWKSAEDVVAHSLFVSAGTRAIVVAPNRYSSQGCVAGTDAVAVRLLDPPYRNRYGYVYLDDLRVAGG